MNAEVQQLARKYAELITKAYANFINRSVLGMTWIELSTEAIELILLNDEYGNEGSEKWILGMLESLISELENQTENK